MQLVFFCYCTDASVCYASSIQHLPSVAKWKDYLSYSNGYWPSLEVSNLDMNVNSGYMWLEYFPPSIPFGRISKTWALALLKCSHHSSTDCSAKVSWEFHIAGKIHWERPRIAIPSTISAAWPALTHQMNLSHVIEWTQHCESNC